MISCTPSMHLQKSFSILRTALRQLNYEAARTRAMDCVHGQQQQRALQLQSCGRRSFSVYQRCCNNSDTKWEFFNVPQESTQGQPAKHSRIIQDVIEAQWNPLPEVKMKAELTKQYNRERGKTGVFDLEELLDLIREQNGQDICVIALPKELDYADHMVIVTARSPKHMLALGTFIRKRFKSKHLLPSDKIPKLEGTKANEDWVALDLVNIVLHIFCRETREFYDLETLWAVGSSFDDLTHKKDSEIVRLLQLFE